MEWWRARTRIQKIGIVVGVLVVLGAIGDGFGDDQAATPASVTTTIATTPTGVTEVTSPQSTDPERRFYAGIESGETCAQLFEHRNEIQPGDPRIDEMNEALREIGCYSSSSERTDR